MNTYKIYCHIAPDGKMYIGQTKKLLKSRFGKNGSGYYKQEKFRDGIDEFGWDNFKHICLFENLSSEMADIIERELIKKYNTIEEGYNDSPGGKTVYVDPKPVYQYYPDGNLKKSYDSVEDVIHSNLDFGYSNIYAALNSDAKSAYGYLWSYIGAEKIEPYSSLNNKSPDYMKKIYQYDIDGYYIREFDSIKSASDLIGLKSSTRLSQCVTNECGTSGGFQWRSYKKEYIGPANTSKNGKGTIYMYDKNTKLLINEFKNIVEAQKITGNKSIGCPTRKKDRMVDAGGYLWSHTKYDIYPFDHSEQYEKNEKMMFYQYDLEGNYIKSYNNTEMIFLCKQNKWKKYGITKATNSNSKAYGFYWSNKYYEKIDVDIKEHVMIGQYDKVTGEEINIFESTVIAQNKTGVPRQEILRACKNNNRTARGYKWKFVYGGGVKSE